MDLSKLDRTRMALSVIGLIAFIDSFLHWADLSVGGHTYSQYNWNGWSAGLGAWLPMLLLLALGAFAALPALGVNRTLPLGLPLLGALVGALSFIIILLRWITLPSEMGASMSAAFGLYIGLVLAIAAAVFGWLAYRAEGGDFKTVGDSLKQAQGAFRNQQQQQFYQGGPGQQYDPNQGAPQQGYDPNQGQYNQPYNQGNQPYNQGNQPYNQGNQPYNQG